MLLSEIISELLCSNCGHVKEIIIITEKNSYADPPREISYFAYKRINHFNEWLAQLQAKETTEIPEHIYREIYKELNKNINLNKAKGLWSLGVDSVFIDNPYSYFKTDYNLEQFKVLAFR